MLLLFSRDGTPSNIALTVYEAKRSTNVSFTDNKIGAVSGANYLFPNNGRTKLIVQSAAGSNVTIETPNMVDGLAIDDRVIALTAGKLYVIGPFPPSVYSDQVTGKVKVTVSANTDIMAISG